MPEPALSTALRPLASLRLTLAGLLALAVAVVYEHRIAPQETWWTGACLGLLAVNLVAALAVEPRFRRQGALTGFHLCLLLVLVLAALGRLTHLEGRLEIAEGQVFDPAQVEVLSRGPWHPWGLAQGLFEQQGVEVEYHPGTVRGHTRSRVLIRDPGVDQGRRIVEIGDDRPLLVDGYRFYTTHNKGFAALLSWRDTAGVETVGAVHLPSFPLLASAQRNEWRTPAGEAITLSVDPPEPPAQTAWTLRNPPSPPALRLARGEEESLLAVGEGVALSGGSLTYLGLRMWMGYRVSYDPTLPWLFASALLCVLFMAAHFRARWWSRPLPEGGLEQAAGT